jgi:Mg2+ and Co2+ transporter CorA
MPSLPRIRSPRRPRDVAVSTPAERRRLSELEAGGLTWIHLDAPTKAEAEELAERFGWHALDV